MMNRPRRQPDSPSPAESATRPAAIEAYLDARGAGRSARRMLDQVARDTSALDELAMDREWIDEVRSPAAAPDQTLQILGRLGFSPDAVDQRRWRLANFTRRLVTAAVLVLAFVVGMWARSSVILPPQGQATETVQRFERVIESLPMEIDALNRVRGAVFDVGTSLTDVDDAAVGPEPAVRDSESPERQRRPRRQDRFNRPKIEAEGLFAPEFDIESIQALWRDLGVA